MTPTVCRLSGPWALVCPWPFFKETYWRGLMPVNPGVTGAEPLLDAYGHMISFVLVKNGGGGLAANTPFR